ncbi:MAG: YfiR family protein [Methylobacter sp.]
MKGIYFIRWAAVLLLMLYWPSLSAGQELAAENPNKVEAAFLRNFARYVTWPPGVFADDRSFWRICILGNDPFGDVLDNTLAGRAEQGRSFEMVRADTLNELPNCQIVFVAYQDAAKRRAALAALKNLPVLTVSDAPEFLQEGGIIQFHVGDRVEMSINLDQSRSASLTIQTKMLEVSREIVENGEVRKWR